MPSSETRTSADGESRTRDLLITSQLLYQLSYIGPDPETVLFIQQYAPCQRNSIPRTRSLPRRDAVRGAAECPAIGASLDAGFPRVGSAARRPALRADWGYAVAPGLRCLKLRRNLNQQIFACEPGHQVRSDRQAPRVPEKRQRHRRLARDIEGRCERYQVHQTRESRPRIAGDRDQRPKEHRRFGKSWRQQQVEPSGPPAGDAPTPDLQPVDRGEILGGRDGDSTRDEIPGPRLERLRQSAGARIAYRADQASSLRERPQHPRNVARNRLRRAPPGATPRPCGQALAAVGRFPRPRQRSRDQAARCPAGFASSSRYGVCPARRRPPE